MNRLCLHMFMIRFDLSLLNLHLLGLRTDILYYMN
jgi:hypothetical protein